MSECLVDEQTMILRARVCVCMCVCVCLSVCVWGGGEGGGLSGACLLRVYVILLYVLIYLL